LSRHRDETIALPDETILGFDAKVLKPALGSDDGNDADRRII
jgi:hypothetical protein